MNKSRISPDDPRLTAYALGELEAAELAEVEAALAADPAALAIVAEIRVAADQLTAALAGETAEAAAAKPGTEQMTRRRRRLGARRGRWLAYLSVGGLAAACLAALLICERSPPPIRYSGETEALTAFAPSAASKGTFSRFSGALALSARPAPPGENSTNAPAPPATGFAVPLPAVPPVASGSLFATKGGSDAKFAPGGSEDTTVATNNDTVAAAAVAGRGYARGAGGEITHSVASYPPDMGLTVLAKPPPAENGLKGVVTIAIDQVGRISLNGKNVSEDQLVVLLKHVAQIYSDTPVLIQAHESSQIKTLTFVLDACRQAHLNKISLRSR